MRSILIGLIAAALTASAASAQTPSQAVQRLGAYIRTPDHLKTVGAAIALFEPTALAATCKTVKPVKGRAWQPVGDPPQFEGNSPAPKSAEWQETWEVNACGKPGVRSVGFSVRPGQPVTPIPMFPGDSLADWKLQLEAGETAIKTVAPGTLPCEDVAHIQIIGSVVTNRADYARGRWSERWTAAGCGKTATIDVNFAPGPGGQPSYAFQGHAGR